MTRAVIFAGGEPPHDDPWHPFAATAACVAAALEGHGVATTTVATPAELVAVLSDAALLVMQGSASFEPTPDDAELLAVASAHVAAGGGLLALHSAACALPDEPGWESLIGGRWVLGDSWHPEIAPFEVRLAPHVVTRGLDDFATVDERYTALRVADDVEPLAWTDDGAERHPLAWARELGAGRVIYDALGHDERSYESAGRLALLRREADWLLRRDA